LKSRSVVGRSVVGRSVFGYILSWAKSLIKIKEMKLRFAKYILCFQQNQLTQIQKTFLGFQQRLLRHFLFTNVSYDTLTLYYPTSLTTLWHFINLRLLRHFDTLSTYVSYVTYNIYIYIYIYICIYIYMYTNIYIYIYMNEYIYLYV